MGGVGQVSVHQRLAPLERRQEVVTQSTTFERRTRVGLGGDHGRSTSRATFRRTRCPGKGLWTTKVRTLRKVPDARDEGSAPAGVGED